MKTITKIGALALITATLAPFAASATTVEEVVAQMKAQGYTDISVEKSFLGRTEIEGEKNGEEREVVLSKSGEILRDEIELEDDYRENEYESESHSENDGDDIKSTND